MRSRDWITRKTILLALCLTSVVLMLIGQPARGLGRLAQAVLSPLGQAGHGVVVHLRTRAGELLGGPRDDPRVLLLSQQVLAMQQLLDQQHRLIQDLEQWREPLRGFPCRLIDARVVGAEGLPLYQRLKLQAQAKPVDGCLATVRPLVHDMEVALPEKLAVLGQHRVVGRVINCGGHSATLQLVTDRRFQMPGRLWRVIEPGQERRLMATGPGGGPAPRVVRHDGRAGIMIVGEPIPVQVEGDGRQIVLHNVPGGSGVRPGDLLTTGEGELLPAGLTIGRVVRVEPEKQSPHFVLVAVEPLADLARLDEVLIVAPFEPER